MTKIAGALNMLPKTMLQQNAQSYITKKSKNKSVATDIRTIFNAPN
jgi:hypothetical protein